MTKFHPVNFLFSLGMVFSIVSGCAAQSSFVKHPQGNATQTSGSAVQQDEVNPAMQNPALATEKAPEIFQVKFNTSKGDFTIEVTRAWSPNGADRFYNLVKIGYYKDVAIFRAINNFMFQFGIHGDPAVSAKWSEANINDDPMAGIPNTTGTICFAQSGMPNTRSTQMFISLGDNSRLDADHFTPFGKVVEGMDVVRKINTEYGENARDDQGSFQSEGNNFIMKKYPNLDLIRGATLIEK